MRDSKPFLIFVLIILSLTSISSARFLQPDSIIQDKYDPQNLNRYSYVLNNPYKYVDTTGNYVVQVGPTVTGTLGIPGIVGVGGAVGSGLAISYVPGEGVQVGGYNVNAIGVGAGAFGGLEIASINLDKDTSVSDLAGTDKLFGLGGGQGVGVSAEVSLDSDSPPTIGVGAGGGIGGYIFESNTIIDLLYDSGKGSASDFISSELKNKPGDDYYYLQNLNPIPQQPKQEEGNNRYRANNNLNGNGNNGPSNNGGNSGGSNHQGSSGGCGSYMTCI